MKNPRYLTFEKVLSGGKHQIFLDFPGKRAHRYGPYQNRQEAWEQYVRIAKEIYFHFEPEKPLIDWTE